jgi:hypothetical protein
VLVLLLLILLVRSTWPNPASKSPGTSNRTRLEAAD